MPQNYVSDEQTFVRPADTTAYANGDLVANSTTAGSVTALTFATPGLTKGIGMIRHVRLRKTNATATNATFKLHLFNTSPLAPTNGDNGAFVPAGIAGYLGQVAITMIAGTAGCAGVASAAIPVTGATSDTLYGLIEATAAYTPGSAETIGAQIVVEITY